MPTILEIHNRDAGEIVSRIARPTIAAGGNSIDILVLLESVIAGVLLITINEVDAEHQAEADKIVIDKLHENVAMRLKALREKKR